VSKLWNDVFCWNGDISLEIDVISSCTQIVGFLCDKNILIVLRRVPQDGGISLEITVCVSLMQALRYLCNRIILQIFGEFPFITLFML
jgi:hypothetical protein